MFDARVLSSLGLKLNPLALDRLELFHTLLLEANRVMDLTSVPEDEMMVRHYADSLLALQKGLIPAGASLIDVGTGAGFPGLPLAIALPDNQFCLVDSKQKRCDFLLDAVKRLGLKNTRVLCARAETLAQPPYRDAFDVAMARAVAPLNQLAEYLLPYVKPGGKALCWKGPAVLDEREKGKTAALLLGGKLGELVDLGIPGRSHYIQVMDKLAPTPKKYPRKAGIPAKSPLGD